MNKVIFQYLSTKIRYLMLANESNKQNYEFNIVYISDPRGSSTEDIVKLYLGIQKKLL